MNTDRIMALCDQVRETAYSIPQYHGNGYLEKVYENELIVELKACKTIANEHYAQLLHYLKGSGKEHGLLINFGSYKFHIKKFVKTDPSKKYSRILPSLFFAFVNHAFGTISYGNYRSPCSRAFFRG